MNWIRENKKLAGILSVMGVGVVGLGVWLYLVYSDYSEASEKFTSVRNDVLNIRKGKPSPNAKNVEEKTAKVNEYQEKVENLSKILMGLQQTHPITPISETDFQAKLKQHLAAIRQRATSAQMKIPDNFALAFDEYTASLPKTAKDAEQLNLHFDVIEKFVSTFIDSGVKEVATLERTKLPFELGSTMAAPVTHPTPQANNRNKPPQAAAVVAVEPVVERFPIKVVFTCDQSPFQAVLNKLADPNYPYFMVVRQVRVENTRLDAPLKDELKNRPVAAPGAPIQDAVTIMGDEKLQVYLEVDYIRFKEAGKDLPQTTAAKK